MKASVNQDGCISCGMCTNICPEVFSFNEEDKAVAIEGEIPAECIDTAKEARSSCPVSVIDIEE